MALEIERRFLVRGDHWRPLGQRPIEIRQGYLSTGQEGLTLRVRLARPPDGPDAAFLTLKAPAPGLRGQAPPAAGQALERLEFEYPIPAADGEALLELGCHRLIKTRYRLDLPGGEWVLDVFGGANLPLVVAEVELKRVDQPLDLPDWCVLEITGRRDLSNAALARQPLAAWAEADRAALLAQAGSPL